MVPTVPITVVALVMAPPVLLLVLPHRQQAQPGPSPTPEANNEERENKRLETAAEVLLSLATRTALGLM